MNANVVDRTFVLLSLQRALLGEVFPALRAVTVEWSPSAVKFFAYVDGRVTEEDAESVSCVATSVAADLWSGVDFDYEIVRVDARHRIEDTRAYVYSRREDAT